MSRWGIVGPGSIATSFAEAMQLVPEGSIVSVASRSAERAETFAARFEIPHHYGDYRHIADDPEVDVVYVSTPQSRHELDTLDLLRAGKHVLCEKPFALNVEQSERMVGEARQRGLFLMDAIWSRFLPAYQVLGQVLDEGRIGEPLLVEADFGFRSPLSSANRLFRADLGGGGLLDLGIYPLQLCSLVLGHPIAAVADGVIGDTGVDEQVAVVIRHPGAKLGVIKAAIRVNMACTARISGTDGIIQLPAMMHCPNSITVTSAAGTEEIDCSYEGNGLRFEIEEVQRCLESGLIESERMPLDETLVLMSTLDAIRRQIGLQFPDE
jgi:predicted dehydrogenase